MSYSVLVLGGSYFIGKAIVDTLCAKGYAVTMLNRGSKPNPQVNTILCDRDNPGQMKLALKDYLFDFVVDVSGLTKIHAETVCQSLNISKLKQYLFISSSAVYDIAKGTLPLHETSPLGVNPDWGDYGTNKIEAETSFTQFFANTKASLVILRPPYVYGENNYAQRESFIFDSITKGEPIFIPNDGSKLLQFIYAPDLAQIIVTLMEQSLPTLSIYNVGNTSAISVRDWISACAKAMDKSADIRSFDYQANGYAVRDFFPFHDFNLQLDTSAIHEVYPTETDFITGLQNAYQWYLDNADEILFKETVAANIQKIQQINM